MDNTFMSKVFKHFGVGLLITFLVGYAGSTSKTIMNLLYNSPTYIFLIIIMLLIAIILPLRINKLSSTTATILYYLYAAITGLTFTSIFIIYELTSIIYIFGATSVIFLLFGFIGTKTNMNLNKLGTYLFIGLIAVILLEIINIFIANNTLDMGLCIISLLIFIGYVAYDMQIIARTNSDNENYAVIAAFNIYLDFINIFIKLLRIFGKQRD